ncbi:DNA ligase [Blastopirellula marina]|uniref:DNA ligase n=1 Tax=Blastopirellula marina TaxID=124 RepID=A0A2S8FPA3_9BACT|nr:DNA ligase [Blastopirellula marina]PQO34002.1 DNA ligase [Blastopirellula marina]PTL43788.1 DNA ligase [Blastopirellula marina]
MSDLNDGESVEVKGSGAKPYVLKNVGGVYSCTCPAWRNQSTPIERRTCKHLRKLRGEDAERERLGGELPAKPVKAATEAKGPPLLLAQSWDNATDLSGWWMSEKLDGVRAYWNGKQFLSRQGNIYHAPDWFVEGLPSTPLDGELWIDRKRFQQTVSVVRRQDKSDHWKNVRLLVFDAPECEGSFENRLEHLAEILGPDQHPYAALHQHQCCRSLAHLQEELARVEQLGGEGLMLREPGSNYEVGRSTSLLKVKRFHDTEAVVLDHRPGKGKFKGMLGALIVQLPDGTEFSVGTGFSDAQRVSPPPPGSVITFRYQELSDGGVPRFPSFVRMSTEAPQPITSSPNLKSVSVNAASPQKQDSDEPVASETRYFEFSDGKSNKFWEVSIDTQEVTVRYGRIGANGTTKVKELANVDAARKHYEKLISEKESKGYTESET